MTTDVKFRDEYSGEIDGKTVASFYRAYAEEAQPYCILLHEYGIAVAQQPSITDSDPDYDDQTPEEHVASDREAAVAWVDTLTELVWKAREYDEMMQAVFELEEVTPYAFAELPADPFDISAWLPVLKTVDKLTLHQSDREWKDRDGLLIKFDGGWKFNDPNYDDEGWVPFTAADEKYLLNDFGPYTADGWPVNLLDDPAFGDLTNLTSSVVAVDRLTFAGADRVWESRIGDRFKFKNGSWHVAMAPLPAEYHYVYVASLLQSWGPYTVVEPRKVKSLTESERDAEWTFQGDDSRVFNYKWDAETWMGTHTSDVRGPNTWDDIGPAGPFLSPTSDTYLVEVL